MMPLFKLAIRIPRFYFCNACSGVFVDTMGNAKRVVDWVTENWDLAVMGCDGTGWDGR